MNKSSGAAWLTYICFTWLVWISAWDCTNAAHGQVFSFACSSDHMVSLCLTCKHMLNSKNVDKSGLKHAFNWKKRCSLIGSVSAQRHLLHLSELIFFWRKGRKYNFICPLKIIPPSGPGTRVKHKVFPNNKINYAPVDHSSVGLKVCFYVHKCCQTMKVNVLFQNGPWLMRTKGRSLRPIFPYKARNRRAVNSFCFPAILLVSLIALLSLWWLQASHIFED